MVVVALLNEKGGDAGEVVEVADGEADSRGSKWMGPLSDLWIQINVKTDWCCVIVFLWAHVPSCNRNCM